MSINDSIANLLQQGAVRLTFMPSQRVPGGLALAIEQMVPTESGSVQVLHGIEGSSPSDCLNKAIKTVSHCSDLKAHIVTPKDGSIINLTGGN